MQKKYSLILLVIFFLLALFIMNNFNINITGSFLNINRRSYTEIVPDENYIKENFVFNDWPFKNLIDLDIVS